MSPTLRKSLDEDRRTSLHCCPNERTVVGRRSPSCAGGGGGGRRGWKDESGRPGGMDTPGVVDVPALSSSFVSSGVRSEGGRTRETKLPGDCETVVCRARPNGDPCSCSDRQSPEARGSGVSTNPGEGPLNSETGLNSPFPSRSSDILGWGSTPTRGVSSFRRESSVP